MKTLIFRSIIIFAVSLLFSGCEDLLQTTYVLKLPQTPDSGYSTGDWVSILGAPHWRLEWLDTNGQMQKADIRPGENLVVELPVTWVNPVTAWPYWPSHNLIPGQFMPAGALFPFDVYEGSLVLSWESGPDVIFYRELSFAGDKNLSRSPAYFDWNRFRGLFRDKMLDEAVLKDPWLVDWRSVAEKTVASGFDRRRLVPKPSKLITIPALGASTHWFGASPFAKPLIFAENENPAFPVSAGVNVWISTEGILRCTADAWVFQSFLE